MEHSPAYERFNLVREVREAVVTNQHRRANGIRLQIAAVAVIGMASASVLYFWPRIAALFAAWV